MYTRIVVPLDGSPVAEQALPEAVRLARLAGATVHLIQVMDLLPAERQPVLMKLVGPDYAKAITDEETQIRAYLTNTAADLRERGARVSTEVRQGRVVPELLKATMPEDVIVMSTHGRSGVRRVALGSVAEDLVHHATVPVLLIKAGTVAADLAPQRVAGKEARQ